MWRRVDGPAATSDHSEESAFQSSYLTVSTGVETPLRVPAATTTSTPVARDHKIRASAPSTATDPRHPFVPSQTAKSTARLTSSAEVEDAAVALPVNSEVFLDEMSSLQQFGPQGSAPMIQAPECETFPVSDEASHD